MSSTASKLCCRDSRRLGGVFSEVSAQDFGLMGGGSAGFAALAAVVGN